MITQLLAHMSPYIHLHAEDRLWIALILTAFLVVNRARRTSK